MKTNDKKTIISLCPFQTQLVVQVPVSREAILKGVTPQPQILKVQCDRDKCQLWDTKTSVCAVYDLAMMSYVLSDAGDDVVTAIRDIVEQLQEIKKHITTWLPSP